MDDDTSEGGAGRPSDDRRTRVVAYLSETSASFDGASLAGQKAAVDAAAASAGLVPGAYFVEVSPPPSDHPWGAAALDILLRARAGALDAVVLAGIERFAVERDSALLIAVHLAECGVRVVEAEVAVAPRALPPTPDRAAARRRPASFRGRSVAGGAR